MWTSTRTKEINMPKSLYPSRREQIFEMLQDRFGWVEDIFWWRFIPRESPVLHIGVPLDNKYPSNGLLQVVSSFGAVSFMLIAIVERDYKIFSFDLCTACDWRLGTCDPVKCPLTAQRVLSAITEKCLKYVESRRVRTIKIDVSVQL